MKFRRFWITVFAVLLAITTPTAIAGSHQVWNTASTVGAVGLLVASLGIPAARQDWTGMKEAAYSDGIAEGASLLLKATVHEERPDHSNDKSFPSGHSTLAFAAATTLYRRYGWKYGAPAYAVAAFTAYGRVAARKHHWWDVVAGAAIGTASGWLVTHPFNKNVTMIPWATTKGGGVLVAVNW